MVAYLAEKVEKCLLNGVVKYCLCTIRMLSVIWSREVAMKQGFLKYSSEWRCSRDQGECLLKTGWPLIRGSC